MGKNILYIECNTGISGDMTVASLLDLGADRKLLEDALESVRDIVGGFDIRITEVEKSGLRACDFDVVLGIDNHDHDMNYLYGHDTPEVHGAADGEHHEHSHEHIHEHTHGHEHTHEDSHGYEHEHAHEHTHEHEHEHTHEHTHGHTHEHVHRTLRDVTDIINAVSMTGEARSVATRIFEIIAEAEAAVHGRAVDEVHFHEVGAIDSIVDIVAAAICYDSVKRLYHIEETVITRLVDGYGTVRCQHGVIPVPVPAVLKIAEQTGVPLSISDRRGEYVTPTGAAFAAAVMTERGLPQSFTVKRVGMGAGKRDHEVPGIVRSMIIEV